ncbi:MAG: outer membrane beta-barrel protein [Gammaproteobacteria bacterium]
MKKSLLTKSIIAAGIVGSLTAANAGSLGDLKFYAGAGVDYNMYSFDSSLKDDNNITSKGIGFTVPILGVKFHENFGLEAGYSFNKKITSTDKADPNDKDSIKVRNMYIDLMGFMPVADQFELLGGLGLGKLSLISNATGISKNKTSWRAKIGAQYNVVTNLALRAVFSYQNADKTKIGIKNVKNIGLYGVYTF